MAPSTGHLLKLEYACLKTMVNVLIAGARQHIAAQLCPQIKNNCREVN